MRKWAPKVAGGHVLFVPPSHVIHGHKPFGVCTVIVNADGDVCRHPSFSRSEYVNHAADCARAHESAIRAFRARQHPEILNPWDPEMAEWMGRHKDAILEGRLTV
jgi:hypothetical protein